MITIVIPCGCGMYRNCNGTEITSSSRETLAADLAQMQLEKPRDDIRIYGVVKGKGVTPLKALKHLGLV